MHVLYYVVHVLCIYKGEKYSTTCTSETRLCSSEANRPDHNVPDYLGPTPTATDHSRVSRCGGFNFTWGVSLSHLLLRIGLLRKISERVNSQSNSLPSATYLTRLGRSDSFGRFILFCSVVTFSFCDCGTRSISICNYVRDVSHRFVGNFVSR